LGIALPFANARLAADRETLEAERVSHSYGCAIYASENFDSQSGNHNWICILLLK
jgi:hypothetical protein